MRFRQYEKRVGFNFSDKIYTTYSENISNHKSSKFMELGKLTPCIPLNLKRKPNNISFD
uniref:Uncharacterized protein n=1 Tax=Anguilla anguilla TaxID=7936 RepID=A0A0E9TZL8_ANGAN